jgi:hypothetical protein
MTFDQALVELGIDRDAGPEEARRAYLKLLKTRRPETDPQGFMRLREAFDRLKDTLAARQTFRLAIEARAAIPELTPPPPAVAPTPVIDTPLAAPADLGEMSAPNPAVSKGSAPAEAEAVEGNAIEDDEDEATEEPPSEAEADRLLAGGDRAGAADELACLFDAAADLGRPPPFLKAMRLVLELHEDGDVDSARMLEASVVAWLRASGEEVRILRGNLAIAWAMTRELGTLRRKFPSKARTAIARGVRTGDLGEVQSSLAALRDRRPTVAEEAAGRLRVYAPVLAQQFANILDPPAPAHRVARGSQGSRSSWWLILCVLGPLSRLFASSSSTPTSTPDSYRDYERDYGRAATSAIVADSGAADAGQRPAKGKGTTKNP